MKPIMESLIRRYRSVWFSSSGTLRQKHEMGECGDVFRLEGDPFPFRDQREIVVTVRKKPESPVFG